MLLSPVLTHRLQYVSEALTAAQRERETAGGWDAFIAALTQWEASVGPVAAVNQWDSPIAYGNPLPPRHESDPFLVAQLIAGLALWQDTHWGGGEHILRWAAQYARTGSPPVLEPGTDTPATDLLAELVDRAPEWGEGFDVGLALARASSLYNQALDSEAVYHRRQAAEGLLAWDTPVGYLLVLADNSGSASTEGVEPPLYYRSARAAWTSLLHRHAPHGSIAVVARHADGTEHPILESELRQAAFGDRPLAEGWESLGERLLREAETAWVLTRLNSAPRYILRGPQDPAPSTLEERFTSAALEAAVLLEDPAVLDAHVRLSSATEPEIEQLLRNAPGWRNDVTRALTLAENLELFLPLATDTEQLATSWKILHTLTLHRAADSGLSGPTEVVLEELTARDTQAQLLRAFLEPPHAEVTRAILSPGFYDVPQKLDQLRTDQVNAAQWAARAYTSARILNASGFGSSPERVVERELSRAGVTDDDVLAAVSQDPLGNAVVNRSSSEAGALWWRSTYPEAEDAWDLEQRSANRWIALVGEGQSPSVKAAAQAAYWQLRADRTDLIHSALAHLSGRAAPSDGYVPDAVHSSMDDDALRVMTAIVFGSQARATQYLQATADYLQQLNSDTAAQRERVIKGSVPPHTFYDVQGAAAHLKERASHIEALRRAGTEIQRLFPRPEQQGAARAGVDSARVQQAARDLAAGSDARRQMLGAPPAYPLRRSETDHSASQQTALHHHNRPFSGPAVG